MPMKPEDLLTDEQKKKFDELYDDDRWALIQGRNRKDPNLFDFQFAIRAPDAKEFSIYKSRALDKGTQAVAQKTLVRQCLIFPTLEKMDAVANKYPGVYDNEHVTRAIQVWTGMASDDAEK